MKMHNNDSQANVPLSLFAKMCTGSNYAKGKCQMNNKKIIRTGFSNASGNYPSRQQKNYLLLLAFCRYRVFKLSSVRI